MSIHEVVKGAMKEHKSKIELTQWATMSSVASLVYSEYIRRIRQKLKPVHAVFVPSIHTVMEFMDKDGQFMSFMSEKFIDLILEDTLFTKYKDAPEFQMFSGNNVEILKTIMDLYIIPNLSARIPATISKKFGIGTEQQLIRESPEIDLFERRPIDDIQMMYLTHQFVLQMLALMPTVKKEAELPEENINISLADNEVISISNDNAICTIHFDESIISNPAVNQLLSFVTNTTFTRIPKGDIIGMKDDRPITFKVTTGPFNQVAITRFGEIAKPQPEANDNQP